MKKGLMMMLFASMVAASATAQVPEWLKTFKISGYGMTQYQATTQKGAKANSFNIRLGRLIVDANPHPDWTARVQFQYSGSTADFTNGIRVVDVFAEWKKYDFFKVKFGQFKRAFTFENPMHPIDQGFMSYSQNVSKFAGFADRDGSAASNGRDIGIQLQGDFLKNANGRNLLHYQIGVYNGQGINQKDIDQQKDVIGGLWVMPVKGLRIGAFGYEGSYARKGQWTDEQGVKHNGVRKLPQHRYALSGEYRANDWTLRSEYIHSTGMAFSKKEESKADRSNTDVNTALGSKADGVYVLGIAPIIKNKFHVKARWDTYRESADWNTAKTYYEVGADYMFSKNIQLNVEYALVNDKSRANRKLSDSHNYSIVDCELDFRF
jgi:hypothetical protein